MMPLGTVLFVTKKGQREPSPMDLSVWNYSPSTLQPEAGKAFSSSLNLGVQK